jgi:hypothetical protein
MADAIMQQARHNHVAIATSSTVGLGCNTKRLKHPQQLNSGATTQCMLLQQHLLLQLQTRLRPTAAQRCALGAQHWQQGSMHPL